MDFFVRSFFTVGLASLIGAIVGGGLKAFGVEIPLLASKARQAMLGVVGLGMVGFALILNLPVRPSVPPASSLSYTSQSPLAATSPEPAPPANHTIATNSVKQRPVEAIAGCQNPEQALTCLPSSSRQVAFADPQAANAVAWENIRNGLSTSQAEAVSLRRGASGRAARLCGIIESNDSSPLGLHLAAVKLNGSADSEGVVDTVCATLIGKLL